MPLKAGTTVEQNFTRGLITEVTGLNMPENASTDTLNCVFEQKGIVHRRLGIDIEAEAETTTYGDTGAITEYVWRAVAKTGLYTFLVMQVGEGVTFYTLNANGSLSSGIENFAVPLTVYKADAAFTAQDVAAAPCAFASGYGRLFIAHPFCRPIVVEYLENTLSISTTPIDLQIRDFEGVNDGLKIDEQPATLSKEHNYNLKNQGWFKDVRMV